MNNLTDIIVAVLGLITAALGLGAANRYYWKRKITGRGQAEVVISPPVVAPPDPPIFDPPNPLPTSDVRKSVISSIVSVYETGSPSPGYGVVALLKDGAGITYGKHQATDKSGSLDAIVKLYIEYEGQFVAQLSEYVARLSSNDTSRIDPDAPPEWVRDLMELLEMAGKEDILMAEAQDDIFDTMYWEPAADQCREMQLVEPLSWLVIYDTTIQSGVLGVGRIRPLFSEVPPSKGGDERAWTTAFNAARDSWLRSSSTEAVQISAYRTASIKADLIEKGNWALQTPLTITLPGSKVIVS